MMNPQIFMKIIGDTDITKAFLNMSENEDELGTVLRVHLLSERLLDAWVASTIGNEELFLNAPGDRLKFNPTFSLKLALAKKLGLHDGACTFLSRINKLRNNFAHQYDCGPLSESEVTIMTEAITSMPKNEKLINLNDVNFAIFDDEGVEKAVYAFSSQSTPNRIKLICMFANLFARLTHEASIAIEKINPLGFRF